MKKIGLFALITLIVFVSFTEAAYVDEYPESYSWAFQNGITTQPTIEKANMYGRITRIELSKIIGNYAINVLNKKVDTSKKCQFSDISDKLNIQYDSGVTKSCQLGLMGQGITKFRPYDKVTRAEFGTILSRLLYGDKYDGGKPYYKKHLNQLNIRGIMTNISNPEKGNELRGNVMVMLKRSQELGNYKIPTFEELDDVISDKCLNDFGGYDNVYKRSFIIPYKDGYIGYDYGGNSGMFGYYLTYKSLDNPCEIISKTDEIFIWNASYKYEKEMYNSYEYPDNKLYISDGGGSPISDIIIKYLNCKEGDNICAKEVDKFMYNLIIGEEEQEYFTQWMNKFKKDIDNNVYTSWEFWNNRRKYCFDKADKIVDNSGIKDGNLLEKLRNEERYKCTIEYLKN